MTSPGHDSYCKRSQWHTGSYFILCPSFHTFCHDESSSHDADTGRVYDNNCSYADFDPWCIMDGSKGIPYWSTFNREAAECPGNFEMAKSPDRLLPKVLTNQSTPLRQRVLYL